ncbi:MULTISPECIES: hypothetical protein [unclassified Tolypothrix]|nr:MULTISPECIES: hypothetical protein [unclassified Tolypothrix]EKF03110.1 hypothetical protein FDUTEX481_05913 [Tolypothrix sp. PCC 7601]
MITDSLKKSHPKSQTKSFYPKRKTLQAENLIKNFKIGFGGGRGL